MGTLILLLACSLRDRAPAPVVYWEMSNGPLGSSVRYDFAPWDTSMRSMYSALANDEDVDSSCLAEAVHWELFPELTSSSNWYAPLACQNFAVGTPVRKRAFEEARELLDRVSISPYQPLHEWTYRESVEVQGAVVRGSVWQGGATATATVVLPDQWTVLDLDCARWSAVSCASEVLRAQGVVTQRLPSLEREEAARRESNAAGLTRACPCDEPDFFSKGCK